MEIRTFDHLAGRDGIRGTLQVAGCVIEQEKALGVAICFALENVDCMFDLVHERLRIEVAIAVLAWFEHNAGLSEGRLAESMKRYIKKRKNLLLSHRHPHSAVKKSETISDCPSPFGLGAGRLSWWFQLVFLSLFWKKTDSSCVIRTRGHEGDEQGRRFLLSSQNWNLA